MSPTTPCVREYLDKFLRLAEVGDYPGALNGLQIENSGALTRIIAAVDACEAVIDRAAGKRGTLLLVHHGLFWRGAQPVCGAEYRKLKRALDGDLALYSAHLPLDAHPVVGNNALLCRALGLGRGAPFFETRGTRIGRKVRASIAIAGLVRRLEKAAGGPVKRCLGGPGKTRVIGIVTGGAGGELHRAAAEGVDTFITGEGPHWSYTAAEELGINVLYAGHYATETFGVKALAGHLSRRFEVPWEFIDHPTGL